MDTAHSEITINNPSVQADIPSLVFEIFNQLSEPHDISRISCFQKREYTKKKFDQEIYGISRKSKEFIINFSHLICRYDKLSFTQFAIKYFDHYESQATDYISKENALKIFKVLSAKVYPDDIYLNAERIISSDEKCIHESLFSLVTEGCTEMAPTIEMFFKLQEIKCSGPKDSTHDFVELCSDYLISSLMVSNSQSEMTYGNSLSCAVYLSTRLQSSFGKCLLQITKEWAHNDDLDGFPNFRSISEERSIFARRMFELSALTPRKNLKLDIQMDSISEYCSLENILMSLVTAQYEKYQFENEKCSPEAIPSEEYLLTESILRHSIALPSHTLMKLLLWESREQKKVNVPRDFIEGFVENLFNQNFHALDKYKLTQLIMSSCSMRRKLLLLKLYEMKMNGEDTIESILSETTKECDLNTLPDVTEISLAFISESRRHSRLFVCLVQKANLFLNSLRTNTLGIKNDLSANTLGIKSDPSAKSISRLISFIESKLSDESTVKSERIKLEYVTLMKESGFLELIEQVVDIPLRDELKPISEIFIQSFSFAQNYEPSVQNKIVEILFNISSHPTEIGRWALGVINRISFSQYATQKNNVLCDKTLCSLKNFSLIVNQNENSYGDDKISTHVKLWLETCSILMTSSRLVSLVLNSPDILNEIIGLRSLLNSINLTDQIEKLIERIKYSSLSGAQWHEASIHESCDRLLSADDVYSSKTWLSRLVSLVNANKNNTNTYHYVMEGLNNCIRQIIQNPNNKNLPALCAKIQYILSHLYDNKVFMSHFHESELSETIRNSILPIRSGDGMNFYEAYDIVAWSEFFPSEFFKIE